MNISSSIYEPWLGVYPKNKLAGLSRDILKTQILTLLDPASLAKVCRVCKTAWKDASDESLWQAHLFKIPQRLWSVGPGVSAREAFNRTATLLTKYRYYPSRSQPIINKELLPSKTDSHSGPGRRFGPMVFCGKLTIIPVYYPIAVGEKKDPHYGTRSIIFQYKPATIIAFDIETKAKQVLALSQAQEPSDEHSNRFSEVTLCTVEDKIFAFYRKGGSKSDPKVDSGVIDIWSAKDLDLKTNSKLKPFKTILIDGYFPVGSGVVFDRHLFVSFCQSDKAPNQKKTAKILAWNISTLLETHNFEFEGEQCIASFAINAEKLVISAIDSIKIYKRETSDTLRLEHSQITDNYRYTGRSQTGMVGSYVVETRPNQQDGKLTTYQVGKVCEDDHVSAFEVIGEDLIFPVLPHLDLRENSTKQETLIRLRNLTNQNQKQKPVREDRFFFNPHNAVLSFQAVNGDFWLQTSNIVYRITYDKTDLVARVKQVFLSKLKKRQTALEYLIPELRIVSNQTT